MGELTALHPAVGLFACGASFAVPAWHAFREARRSEAPTTLRPALQTLLPQRPLTLFLPAGVRSRVPVFRSRGELWVHRGAADVQQAVNFSGENRWLLVLRGGGHNIAGTAVCDGGLLLDFWPMKSVQMNPSTRRIDRPLPGSCGHPAGSP